MKIIIFGATEFGYLIANEFYQNNDVTLVDKESNRTDEFNKLDISFVNGSASDVEVLMQAGVKESDIFIACTNFDAVNIVACITAKKLSNIKTICFVSQGEYKKTFGSINDNEIASGVYIDYVIWPEEILTKEIFRIITVAKALDVEDFANGRAKLLEYKLEDNSLLVNKKVKDCEFPPETLIVGITRDCKLFIPNGESVLESGDKAIFMGSSHSLEILAGKFFHEKNSGKTVTIIGGGNVGLMLAKDLEKIKAKIKVIEKNHQRCEYLSQVLCNALVIHGDGTDLELLNQEEISDSDAVISVTNNDEKNLLCSLLAKQLGVKRIISRVSKSANIPLFEKVGIDIAVSTKFAAIHEIKNELSETNVDILATVEQGQGEVLEINVPEVFEEIKLMNLKIPVRAIIGIIHRKNRVIIPKGDTLIRGGDVLIVFTTGESVPIVKEFFEAT